MLSDPLDWLRSKISYFYHDEDYRDAVNSCYAALCYNKERSNTFFCSGDIAPIGRIIMCYIEYFSSHSSPDTAKYYYDEYSDRSDLYRKELVNKIAQMSEQDDNFVNEVLSYLYWAIKRRKVKAYILAPIGISKFTEKDWAYTGVFGTLFNLTKSLWEFAKVTLKQIGHIVVTATTGALETVSNVASIIKYLPHIAAGGIVLLAGFQVYHYNKQGKFYGEDSHGLLDRRKCDATCAGECEHNPKISCKNTKIN